MFRLKSRPVASRSRDHTRHEVRPEVLPAAASGAQAHRTVAVGSAVLGALAIGALAIGALAIGRLAIGRARIRRLEIDELVVRRLRIIEQLSTPPKSNSDPEP